MAFYAQHPLRDPDSIRLFELHPKDDTGVISVTLQSAKLFDEPSYVALSYTWDNPLDASHPYYEPFDVSLFSIVCNGEPFAVKQNLYEALLQLQQPGPTEEKGLLLWVDAICIDQENDADKAHQLDIMPFIFNQANHMVAWVGRADETTPSAARVLNIPPAPWTAMYGLHSGDKVEMRKQLESIPWNQRRALQLLIQRCWYHRVWTMLEVRAARRVRYLCGCHELDGPTTTAFAALVSLTQTPLGCDSSVNGDHVGLDSELSKISPGSIKLLAARMRKSPLVNDATIHAFLRGAIQASDVTRNSVEFYSHAFGNFIHDARGWACTKPVDKVLAPLSFMMSYIDAALYRKDAAEKGNRKLVKPLISKGDHTWNCHVCVYTVVTATIIQISGSLNFLSRATRRILPTAVDTRVPCPLDGKLPSWVPEFQRSGETSLLDGYWITAYRAGNYLGRYGAVKIEGQELPVEAVFLCRIRTLSAYVNQGDTKSEWLFQCRNSEAYLNDVERGRNTRDIARRFLCGEPGEAVDLSYYRETQKCHAMVEKFASEFAADTPPHAFIPACRRVLRKLAVSNNHLTWVSLVPVDARISDHICVFRGGKVPFVVRETAHPGKYELVGEAYVVGAMSGEVEHLGIPSQKICLV